MKTGALIYAINNGDIDYLEMANWSAQNIRRHLNIPVCVVTNIKEIPKHYVFEKVITILPQTPGNRYFSDFNKTVLWYNADRADSYYLTPWERTLVLDADYVVASNQLQTILSSSENFLSYRLAFDLTGTQTFDALNTFGRYRMPMHWATVMLFNRSAEADLIFRSMKMVRDCWNHYAQLYVNSSSTFRNDHALSIALVMVNGHLPVNKSIPWGLPSVTPEHTLVQLDIDQYRIEFLTQQQKTRWVDIANSDFHAMGKHQLGKIIAKTF